MSGVSGVTITTGLVKITDKFLRRAAEADYDRFAEHVCNAPWDLIVSGSEMIERKASGEAEATSTETGR